MWCCKYSFQMVQLIKYQLTQIIRNRNYRNYECIQNDQAGSIIISIQATFELRACSMRNIISCNCIYWLTGCIGAHHKLCHHRINSYLSHLLNYHKEYHFLSSTFMAVRPANPSWQKLIKI